MKNFTVAILLIFLLPLALLSCKGNQNQSHLTGNDKDSSSCEVEAKVMDYTGLSSCSILLKLKDGTYLNPVDGYPRQEIHEAKTVKVSYTKIPCLGRGWVESWKR